MTDLNAPLDPTERDAQAWRMLTERLDMGEVDLDVLARIKPDVSGRLVALVVDALHDAIAYRRQS